MLNDLMLEIIATLHFQSSGQNTETEVDFAASEMKRKLSRLAFRVSKKPAVFS